MSDSQNQPDSPGAEIEDDFHAPKQQDRTTPSPAGQLLENFLAVMNSVGDDADERYKTALAALRERAAEAVIEIARLERACGWSDYPTRWALIFATSELSHPASIPFFRSLVTTPIPPEKSDDPHSFSTVAEETILRTTAVDGVAQLARQGDRVAIEALLDFLSVPSLSVKRAAVQGLLHVEQAESLRGRIEERLCPSDRFLLDIRPIDVRQATQIDNPEADLVEGDRPGERIVAPDLPDRTAHQRTYKRGSDSSGEGPACD